MNVPLDATAELPEAQKKALLESIEKTQLRDSMRLYNSLVERCFLHCIDTFRSKQIDSAEDKARTPLTELLTRVRSHSGRIGLRFGELNAEMERKQMNQLKRMQQQELK